MNASTKTKFQELFDEQHALLGRLETLVTEEGDQFIMQQFKAMSMGALAPQRRIRLHADIPYDD